ncbi:MAG: helix-turn-helix transcriptional regulator [Pyrinomonadaceae bacterium]
MKDDAEHQESQPRDEFLTARQLATILQVSETTVRRLAHKGRIPCIRLTPRLTRFHLQSVRNALNGVPASRPRHTSKAAENSDENPQLSFSDLL